jgi:hypothetical protein
MPLNLDDFMGEIRSHGIQKTTRFLVEVNPPQGLNLRGPILGAVTDLLGSSVPIGIFNDLLNTGRTRQLGLRCSAATFPGIQLMTKDDVVRYGMGPVDKTVHHALFSDITCQFILDREGLVQDFFYKWQQSIINTDSSDTMTTEKNGASPYEVTYKDDYVSMFKITQYDERGKRVVTCSAQKAFPAVVGDVQMSWDSSGAIAILPVTFSYRDHVIRKY